MKFRLDDDTCSGVRGVGVFGRHPLNTVAFDTNFWRMLLERERERERERGERETVRNTHTRLINFGNNDTMSLCKEISVCVCVCVCADLIDLYGFVDFFGFVVVTLIYFLSNS